MGDLLIRDIPEALKADLERRARQSGRSLSEEAKAHIRRSLATEETAAAKKYANAYEAIRSGFEEADALDDGYAKIMDQIEAERKREFGRPLPDME